MEFRILGPLAVVAQGRTVALPRQKSRALLALLLLHVNEALSTDRLVDELWGGDPPRTATASLQNSISRLRKVLGPELLLSRPRGYELRIDPEQLDLTRFERLVADAKSAEPAERAAKLREALALWRGEPLADLAHEPFAQMEVIRLEELHAAALEQRIEADLALGADGNIVGELEALVARHPLRERLRRQLMVALYRAGRQADALAAYQEARRMLDEELGLEPSEELQRLERAILVHDAALEAPRAAAAAAAPEAAPAGRKVVTVLFADLVGYTELGASLDPEALRRVIASFFDAMRTAIEAHGGTIEKFVGDEVMAAFGVPVAHEDDALRAVRAARDMHRALEHLNESLERDRRLRLEMRIGINTGEVFAGDTSKREAFVTGDAVNVGKRLEEAAPPGEIVLGAPTLALVRNAVEAEPAAALQLLGRPEPVEAFRVLGIDEAAAPIARALDAPLVGRTRELARLREEFTRAMAERRCRVVAIVGEAGIGKTRLASELAATEQGGAQILTGHCASYGDGATYLPVAAIVRAAALEATPEGVAALLATNEDAELIARRVAGAVGFTEETVATGDAFWAVRRLLETLARERPLIVVLEDVHWAEPTLLDLVEYLAEWSVETPILVVCVARPELLELRPGWSAWSIVLQPLGEPETRELIDRLAGPELSAETRARVAETSEGNPLFAEQLVVHLHADEEPDEVPPSVEALLASRLDRLDRVERAVLERASIAGREFWLGAVAGLSQDAEAATAATHLLALSRKGLVRAARSSLPHEDAFRFRHVLIRDVAYARIPKELRAELHERFADWLDRQDGSTDETVGFHLERAYRYREELGLLDRAAERLAHDAAERLGPAGVRALARGDTPAAINLLARATTLLPSGDPRRLELLCELGVAQRTAGELAQAERALTEAIEEAVTARDRRIELRARIELAGVQLQTDTEGAARDLLELAEAAVPTFEALGDDRSLGRTWFLTAFVRGAFYCQNAAWEEAAERALVHYRRAGWPTSTCLSSLAGALFFGPRPVEEGIRRCRELLESEVADQVGEANVVVWLGGLEALRGRFDEARALTARARRTYEELGHPVRVAVTCDFVAGLTETLAGDQAAAERVLRASCEIFERIGEWAHLSTRAADLAHVLYAQALYAQADEWTRVAERHAASDDLSAQFSWRSVRAKVLARSGAFDDAEKLAREAVDLVDRTDALNQRANARLDLAHVLRLAGRSEEASDASEEAAHLHGLKGNVVSLRAAASIREHAAPV